jgi:cystathionine beta-synthase
MALKMVEDAELSGKLKGGGTIVEGTSGNTGMGLALADRVKGYKLICVTTDKQSKEKIDVLKAVGATVIICPTNVDPDDSMSYYSTAKMCLSAIDNNRDININSSKFFGLLIFNKSEPQAIEKKVINI